MLFVPNLLSPFLWVIATWVSFLKVEYLNFRKGKESSRTVLTLKLSTYRITCVPRSPDNVSDEQAAFTVVASIGLQGLRLAQPTIGEKFVVIGTGLIGLLTIQLLRLKDVKYWPLIWMRIS